MGRTSSVSQWASCGGADVASGRVAESQDWQTDEPRRAAHHRGSGVSLGVHLWRPRRGLPPPPAGYHPIGGNGVPVLALGWLWFLPAGVWKDPPGSSLPTQLPFPRLSSPGGFLLEASCSLGAALGTPVLGHHRLWEEPGCSTARRPLTVPGCLWPPSRERVFVCTRVGARVNTHAPRARDTGRRAGMRGQQALQNPRGKPQPRKTQ